MRKLRIAITATFLLAALVAFVPAAALAADSTKVPDAPTTSDIKFNPQVKIPGFDVPAGGITVTSDTLPNYLNAFYVYFMGVVGVLAIAMMVFAGFRWITAAGNASRISGAKDTLNSAAIGLVLALTSFLILRTINPNLVTLRIPAISQIEQRLIMSAFCDKAGTAAGVAAQGQRCGTRVKYTDTDKVERTCISTLCTKPGEYCFFNKKTNGYKCVTPETLCENENFSDENDCPTADDVIKRYGVVDSGGNPQACRKARISWTGLGFSADDKCYLRPLLHCGATEERVDCNIDRSDYTSCWDNGRKKPLVKVNLRGVVATCTSRSDARAAVDTDAICCLSKPDIRCESERPRATWWAQIPCGTYMPSCTKKCFSKLELRSSNP